MKKERYDYLRQTLIAIAQGEQPKEKEALADSLNLQRDRHQVDRLFIYAFIHTEVILKHRTLTAVAKELGLSRERTRQHKHRWMKMRKHAELDIPTNIYRRTGQFSQGDSSLLVRV